MTTEHTYHANLARESLADLLVKIHTYRVPGVIEAARADVIKRLYIRDGNVIFATSSAVEDRLDRHLLREGLMTEDQLQTIARERDRPGSDRAGVLIIRHGLMSPRRLNQAIRDQVERIAWSLFSWKDGEACFHIEQQAERNQLRIQIPLRRMVFEGICQSVDLEAARNRLGTPGTIYETTWNGEELIDIGLDEPTFAVLQLVNGKRSQADLLAQSSFDEATTLRVLHACQALKLLRKKNQDFGATTGTRIRLRSDGSVVTTG